MTVDIGPEQIGLLKWLWENVWLPVVGVVWWSLRRVVSSYDKELAEVRVVAVAATTKADFNAHDERMRNAVIALHGKIEANERERSRRHDDLMHAILNLQKRRDAD